MNDILDIFRSIVLGIVQGLTEFLPISSSAHLIITRDILHWPDFGKTYDVSLHFGTLLALLIYFWKDIYIYVKAFFLSIKDRNLNSTDKRLVWVILLSCLPAFVFGAFFDEFFERVFSNVCLIAVFLILFATILWFFDHFEKKERALEDCNFIDALIIGLAQVLALMPGVSRSGITMSAGLFRNFKREAVAKFTFLMSIPVIGGAVIFKVLKLVLNGGFEGNLILLYISGILSAFLSGYAAVRFLLNYLQRNNFNIFIIYRIVLGLFLIIYFVF